MESSENEEGEDREDEGRGGLAIGESIVLFAIRGSLLLKSRAVGGLLSVVDAGPKLTFEPQRGAGCTYVQIP